jgi:hypothetical protein
VGQGLLIHEVSRSHTTTHHSRYDSSGRVISSSQRPLPDNTQHLQQTNIHAPGGIRNNNLSRRAAADLRRRPRGHWDLLLQLAAEDLRRRPHGHWDLLLLLAAVDLRRRPRGHWDLLLLLAAEDLRLRPPGHWDLQLLLAAEDLRLRLHGHWDRRIPLHRSLKLLSDRSFNHTTAQNTQQIRCLCTLNLHSFVVRLNVIAAYGNGLF